MEIIPAIDLLNGKVVRLLQGRYSEPTIYSEDPTALAASWSGRVEHLHVVDLEGARSGGVAQPELIARVARAFGPGVQVGGGVRSLERVEAYLALGVERVVLGTAALKEPDWVRNAATAHPGAIVVAVDARHGQVATDGWLTRSSRSATDVLGEFAGAPLGAVLYTDIERDGTEAGPNVAETARLAANFGWPVIASGGVGSLDHVRALRAEPAISAVIVGRALHERRFSLQDAILVARGAP
jgi:phosphoribosylformimino-5-aminoimidazole carboxamide ribotide isomerase